MDVLLVTVVAATACSAALAGHSAAAWWLAAPNSPSSPRLPPPRFLRPVLPLVRRLGPAAERRLPRVAAEYMRARLRAADLDTALCPGEWTVASLAYGAIGAAALGALAALLGLPTLAAAVLGGGAGIGLTELRLRGRIADRDTQVRRELPLYLDVLTLAVESGASLTSAIALAADKAPDGPLRRGFVQFLGDVRAGRPRIDALRALGARVPVPGVASLVGALIQSEATGARLGPSLRAQAVERTQERFARAEKLAMQAPVRMLAPLILCIFPCTFLVLGFPIVTRLTDGF
jgi:tight adherence protein C